MGDTIKLNANQAALIIDVSPSGEVTVDAAFPELADEAGELAAIICELMGKKLTQDTEFQSELLSEIAAEADTE